VPVTATTTVGPPREVQAPMSSESLPMLDRSSKRTQIAIRDRKPAAEPPPVVTEPIKPPPKKRGDTKAVIARDAAVRDEPPPPKADNAAALAALETTHAMLDTELRRRELLESDVPAYVEAKREMAAALAASDADRAAAELDKARAAIAAVTIDAPFVDKKVQRAGARIGKLPADRKADLSARLNEVLALYTNGDYVKANRKINEIVKLTTVK
jgi:hypothetical protein